MPGQLSHIPPLHSSEIEVRTFGSWPGAKRVRFISLIVTPVKCPGVAENGFARPLELQLPTTQPSSVELLFSPNVRVETRRSFCGQLLTCCASKRCGQVLENPRTSSDKGCSTKPRLAVEAGKPDSHHHSQPHAFASATGRRKLVEQAPLNSVVFRA